MNTSASKRFITLCFLFSLVLVLNWGNYYAQDSINTYRPFSITYSTKDGLPSNQIIYLFNDSKGLMWIGTEQGVASFDGRDFKTYDHEELNQSLVLCIEEDSYGNIWLTTTNGSVFLIDGEKVQPHPQNEKIRVTLTNRTRPSVIAIDSNRILSYFANNHLGSTFWKATYDSVYMYFESTGPEILFKQEGRFIFSNLTLKNMSSKEFIFELPDTSFSYTSNYSFDNVAFYSTADENQFAISVIQKLIYFDGHTLKHVELPSSATHSLTFTNDNSLWLASQGQGAFQINNGQIITNIFSGEKIHCIREDFQGGFWVAMPSSGVRYIPNISVHLYRNDEPAKKVKHLFKNHNSHLCWVTNDAQLYFNGQQANTNICLPIVAKHHKGKIYNDSLFCISYKIPSDTTAQMACINLQNSSIKRKRLGILGTSQRLLKESGGDTIAIQYNCISNLSRNSTLLDRSTHARDLIEYQTYLWVASNKGILKLSYERDRDKIYTLEGVIADSLFWDRLFIVSDMLFGITRDGNIYLVEDSKTKITLIDSPKTRTLLCLRIRNNTAYLGFSDGIAQLKVSNQDNGSPILNFQYLPIDIKLFSSAIFDLEVIKDTLFFACADGIISVNLSEIEDLSHPGKLSINGVKHNDSIITDLSKPLKFYSDDRISFDVTAVRFRNAPDFNYQYRLLPTDTIWHDSKQSELNLFQLPAHDYELQVRLNPDVQQSVAFSVSNYWYQETWFIVLVAILATTLGFLPLYYRVRFRIASGKIEREKNNLRFSTLNIQLKPHFIFNALNSIQSYMLEQDTMKATTYLSKFAQHIRSTLEQSREDLISLSDSLYSLQNYLLLERMRKNNAFDFEITVDPSVNKRSIRIPPLLIQPYVENAIIHGFADIDKGGFIRVHAEKLNSQQIIIQISDNGQGFGKTHASSHTIKLKKKSLATLINTERIETLNALYENKFSVDIKNLHNSKGVIVEIVIPINLKDG